MSPIRNLYSFVFYFCSLVLVSMSWSSPAHALPSFAIREKVSCTMCHMNGSAPHLTKTGYLYRRAGFRFPSEIGDRQKDDSLMRVSEHLAAGVNVSYEVVTQQAQGATASTLTSNNFNVREVEVWPAVGAFMGNFGAWSELDANPTTNGGTGSVTLSQADLRYVTGSSDFFFNFRAGIMAPEGYGASDQWLDDANIPLMDTVSAQYNQDTLVLPFGAMETPELGAEFGLNYFDTHLTLGLYNGFDGTSGSAVPALMPQVNHSNKDYKVQLDQFFGEHAVTLAYYNGRVPLQTPTGSTAVNYFNNYNLWRLYLTYQAVPRTVELMTGGATGSFDWFDPAANQLGGRFNSRGVFVGANYYALPRLTLSARVDYDRYNDTPDNSLKANSYVLMASVPMDNNLLVFHYNKTVSDISGLTNDWRMEWRFLF